MDLFDVIKYKDAHFITCKECKSNIFKVIQRAGGGGSGTYFKYICQKCGETFEIDFDNPEYDG